MRKNVKWLALTGVVLLAISIICLVFFETLSKFEEIAILFIMISFTLSVIFLSISTNLLGKGDHLLLNDLVHGKEYILIDHMSVSNEKSFSLVGVPNSEKFVTVHGCDDLNALGPKQPFIIVKGEVRKLS